MLEATSDHINNTSTFSYSLAPDFADRIELRRTDIIFLLYGITRFILRNIAWLNVGFAIQCVGQDEE